MRDTLKSTAARSKPSQTNLAIVIYGGDDNLFTICQNAQVSCRNLKPTSNLFLVNVPPAHKCSFLSLLDQSDLRLRIVEPDANGRFLV